MTLKPSPTTFISCIHTKGCFRDKFRRHELEKDIYRCRPLIHVYEICLWNSIRVDAPLGRILFCYHYFLQKWLFGLNTVCISRLSSIRLPFRGKKTTWKFKKVIFWKWKALVTTAYIVGSDFPASFSLISKKWKEKVNPQKAWKKWTLYWERRARYFWVHREQVSDVWVSTGLRKTFLKWPYNLMRSFFIQ